MGSHDFGLFKRLHEDPRCYRWPVDSAVLDGEAILLRSDNTSDFDGFRSRQGQAEAILVAYDVMNRPTNFRAALSGLVEKIAVLELDARLAYQRRHLLNAVQAAQSRPVIAPDRARVMASGRINVAWRESQ